MSFTDYCAVCGRWRNAPPHEEVDNPCRQKVEGGQVYYHHDGYGCDTGCCGHSIVVEDRNGNVIKSEFEFVHDKEDLDYRVGEIADRLKIKLGECQFSDD